MIKVLACGIGVFIAFITIILIAFVMQLILLIGSSVSTGSGSYTGILVETRHHGILFKTNGAHFKTGENSSIFEDFCVPDKKIMKELQQLPPESKIEVSYKKLLSAPSWKCDGADSSDIITGFKVINP